MSAPTPLEQVDAWNASYPKGTTVRCQPAEGPRTGRGSLEITSSDARVLDHHGGIAVVGLAGKGTPVALHRLSVLPFKVCAFCPERVAADDPDLVDEKLFWHQRREHPDEMRAIVLAEIAVDQEKIGRWLYRMLGRGWKILVDPPPPITEARKTYWYAAPCDRSTPPAEALQVPGVLRHTDPYELAKLGRAVNADRRRAAG